ncbi:MAG: fluoride efflux transporter CrcB [Candidatus Neomarinimicrobiota bacterium]|nr:MAG: fluoride efflux transporter CrcB [Candidatus Neomarinimicrobiota bacterium]
MIKIFFLMAGGALGTLARYGVSGISYRLFNATFPYGTLVVNLIGSLLIGFLWGFWELEHIPVNIKVFVFIGILGGFTTFSSFMLETLNLLREGEIKFVLINILLNNMLGLLFVFGGYFFAKIFVQGVRP